MLDVILESCRVVSEQSKYVSINHDKLNNIKLNSNGQHWLENSEIMNLSTEEAVKFLIAYHSIGFSYWGDPKWTINSLDGADAMLDIFLSNTKNNPAFLNPDYQSNLSYLDCSNLLQGNTEIPLLLERYINLTSLGSCINHHMRKDFYAYTKNMHTDRELFEAIITSFGSIYRDISKYNGNDVMFYKRAQLAISDILQIRRAKEGIDVEYSNLVGCADYKIPQLLRHLGILEYTPELANLVDNQIEIPSGSELEVEIRANTIVAIDLLSKRMNKPAIEVNDMIWLASRDKIKAIKPYHRTRTTAY